VRSPTNHDQAIRKGQARALILKLGVEVQGAAGATIACTRYRRLNGRRRPPELLDSRGDVNGMKSRDIVRRSSGNFLGSCNEVKSVRVWVDDGRALNSYVPDDVKIVGSHYIDDRNWCDACTGIAKVHAPQYAPVFVIAIGVKCIQHIVHRGDVEHIVRALAWNSDIRYVERLRLHRTINRVRENLAELPNAHV